MNVKRMLTRLAQEAPCLVSLLILTGFAQLVTGCIYGWKMPVSWPVACLIFIVIGVGWALLEVWCIRRKWLRVEHLSFLNIEACILCLPILPWVMLASGIGIEVLMLWTPLLIVLAVRLISWWVCRAEKRALRQGWLVLGGIVSEILMLLISWGCSELVWAESAWVYLLLFAALLLGRAERTALAWFDGTNIATALLNAVQLLCSDPAYLPGMALAAGLCAVMACAAGFARKQTE